MRLRTPFRAASSILALFLLFAALGQCVLAQSSGQDGVASSVKKTDTPPGIVDDKKPASDDKKTASAKKPSDSKKASDSNDDKDDKTGADDKGDSGSARKVKTGKKGSLLSSVSGDSDRIDANTVVIDADKQNRNGDIVVAEGYVNATMGSLRVQADHMTFNSSTGDLVADGNVIYDNGPDERITANRAELNVTAHRGTFWTATGFTDRTATGEYLYFSAERVVKTGETTYDLYNATVTACEDVIPRWSFHSKQAELKIDDRIRMKDAIFRIRSFPILFFPYMWVPANKRERKSGFLIPTIGNSTQKGRTINAAYFQTLGDSADLTIRGDYYSERGIGLGAHFRLRTDDTSYLSVGVFSVQDRLFGTPGPNQGGTAVVANAVQYLPHDWIAVVDVSLVSSLAFRQVFSNDLSQVIDPTRRSQVYFNKNGNGYSLNFLASNDDTTVFRNFTLPSTGTDEDITIREAPEVDFGVYSRQLFKNVPLYFSMDSAAGALSRVETIAETNVLFTPGLVGRFDLAPKLTLSLPSVAGFTFTPSLTLRDTYYTDSINPNIPSFDPNKFAANSSDVRLDPTNPDYVPGLTIFDPTTMNRIAGTGINRHYAEFDLDIRPPLLEKDFKDADGNRRFRHIIEPYATYRLIKGIGQDFGKIIQFDDRDAIADANAIEYGVTNRFFILKPGSEIVRKRRRRTPQLPEMFPEEPLATNKRVTPDANAASNNGQQPPNATAQDTQSQQQQQPDQTDQSGGGQPSGAQAQNGKTKTDAQDKGKLETGTSNELGKQQLGNVLDNEARVQRANRRKQEIQQRAEEQVEQNELEQGTGDEGLVEPYEFLTVTVAQQYFFDPTFGGALIPGQRNQFYPLNTLSGFDIGGEIEKFTPLKVDVRYRPLASVFADLRMDVGSNGEGVRDFTVSGGFRSGNFAVAGEWFFSRRITLEPTTFQPNNFFEPGTFPGNQVYAAVQFGDNLHGVYGGARVGYDFTDQFLSPTTISTGRLTTSRAFVGYAWNCCGLQLNYTSFRAGLRNESSFSVTFSLAGIGTFGTDQASQATSGRSSKKRQSGLNLDTMLP